MQHLYYIITANLPFHAFPNLACILLAPSPPLFFVSVQINQSPASYLLSCTPLLLYVPLVFSILGGTFELTLEEET